MASIMVTFFLTLAVAALFIIAWYLLWQDWQFFRETRIHTIGNIVAYQTRKSDDSTF